MTSPHDGELTGPYPSPPDQSWTGTGSNTGAGSWAGKDWGEHWGQSIPGAGFDNGDATDAQIDAVRDTLLGTVLRQWGATKQGFLTWTLAAIDNLIKTVVGTAIGGLEGFVRWITGTVDGHTTTLGDHEARIDNLKKSVDGVVQTINGAYQPLYFSGFVELKPTTNLIDVIMIGAGGGGGGGKDGGLNNPNYGGGGGGGGGESHVTINASDVPAGPDGIRRIWITMGGNGTGEQPPQGGGPGVGGQKGADTCLYFTDPSQGTPTVKYRAGGGAGGQSQTNAASAAPGGTGTVPGGDGGIFYFRGSDAVSEAGKASAQPVGVSNGGGGGGAGSGRGGGIPTAPDDLPGHGGGGGPNPGGKPVGGTGTSTTEYLPIGGGGGAGGNSGTPGGAGGDPGGGGGGGGAIGGIRRQTAGGHGGVGRAWIRERT
ncbi:hypothetical protein [Nocardia terpenica]|uniref:hypothetical protein n=1 Tax=Nocardia terpenica TaxID=455432 RepID=UPI000A5DD68A|nr:hypothetical protein [Nocardia terpenica]